VVPVKERKFSPNRLGTSVLSRRTLEHGLNACQCSRTPLPYAHVGMAGYDENGRVGNNVRLLCGTMLFAELQPHFDVSFWYELERLKLGVWRLETPRVVVHGAVPTPSSLNASKAHHLANVVTIEKAGFDREARPTATTGKETVEIDLVNYNTEEEMKSIDRGSALLDSVRPIMKAIVSGEFNCPAIRGVLRTFADLKKHVFSHVVAFPVLDCPAKSVVKQTGSAPLSVDEYVGLTAYEAGFGAIPYLVSADGSAPPEPLTRTAVNARLASGQRVAVAMQDFSNNEAYPSWPWRNVIAALRAWAPNLAEFDLVALRSSPETSIRFSAAVDPAESTTVFASIAAAEGSESVGHLTAPPLRVVGWTASKIHRVDLGAMMDPSRLAESSARLNLGLMKWRMMPDIDLDRIASTKALLLGSGTLGCNIARHLMMWGVNHITFVDRGQVSYSNPVRQTLFELKDCTAEGEARIKSVAAANAIKRILPTCNATGVELTIRMPGHVIDKSAEPAAREDLSKLEELIKAHDVVFLLTDSRESRWLPTLVCAAHNKPVINAALGFDTYVVMRHGLLSVPTERRVGCYFCNDVVAPMDSLTARTLDQQCTVTRPGVSAIASALAVELLAALNNHEAGFECPAYVPSEEEEGGKSSARTIIGVVPHQIRGSVSDYSNMILYGQAYPKCTACSEIVVNLYREKGFEFILECLNNPKHMEEVTGLAAERKATEEKYADWDDDDFDDE
jgi:ubiquitin-like modifier-activating enzyme ATG7